jgi:Fe2+ transport system protein FeoA
VKYVENLVPLEALAAGQSAEIRHIVGEPDHVHRLEEMGLHRGRRVEMFRPGNPCIIRMAGNKVCIRADHRLNVLVMPGVAPA